MIYAPEGSFPEICHMLTDRLRYAPESPNPRWQGTDTGDSPAARMYELRNVVFEVDLGGIDSLEHWRREIEPNLPWADDHFLERVGEEPLNPGVQWRNWLWGKSASRFRGKDEKFNHTYMERLWPRWARMTPDGRYVPNDPRIAGEGHVGIGGRYGDLKDLVEYLVREPSTRQAWIPLFFPEDTGYGDGGRKPCTLGYQFLVRGGRIHIWYPLRSCDLVHHFRDDCYLAVRLLLWVLGECKKQDLDTWSGVSPGTYSMHMTSLHVFEADRRNLR